MSLAWIFYLMLDLLVFLDLDCGLLQLGRLHMLVCCDHPKATIGFVAQLHIAFTQKERINVIDPIERCSSTNNTSPFFLCLDDMLIIGQRWFANHQVNALLTPIIHCI